MSNFLIHLAYDGTEVLWLAQSAPDSTQDAGVETAYDSIWGTQVPVAEPSPLERVMLAEDKIYVVLAVVLIIWFGIVAMLWRTDRKIRILERRVTDRGSEGSGVD